MADSQDPLRILEHGDGVAAFAFSPDGARLVSARHDRTLTLWDAHSGQGKAMTAAATSPGSIIRFWRRYRAGYLFAGPYLVGLLVLLAGPLVFSFVLSLHEWDGVGNHSAIKSVAPGYRRTPLFGADDEPQGSDRCTRTRLITLGDSSAGG